jgi:hypothetical protein
VLWIDGRLRLAAEVAVRFGAARASAVHIVGMHKLVTTKTFFGRMHNELGTMKSIE